MFLEQDNIQHSNALMLENSHGGEVSGNTIKSRKERVMEISISMPVTTFGPSIRLVASVELFPTMVWGKKVLSAREVRRLNSCIDSNRSWWERKTYHRVEICSPCHSFGREEVSSVTIQMF